MPVRGRPRQNAESAPMNATAKLFKLANSQAVRIPARFRLQAEEVEISRRADGALILRAKPRSAADVFAAARAHGADWTSWKRPEQGRVRPIEPLGF